MKCNICQKQSKPFAKAVILEKYNIQYFQCSSCGFIQTESPYWLEEAYNIAINDSDTGLVQRNKKFSQMTNALIFIFFDSNAHFIDYGGGYGLFVRMMRDIGLDFYWHDKFCQNLFARGFEASTKKNEHYELLTAFELFEHLVDPIQELEQMTSISKNILFSTLLLPQKTPKPSDWWYYGLDHGQHISFYTYKSLLVLAKKFGLRLCSNKSSFHLITAKKVSSIAFKFIQKKKVLVYLDFISRKKKTSLIAQDYFHITKKRLN